MPSQPGSRDLVDYTAQYRQLPFEPIQAAYRRRLVLQQIGACAPRTLLEVGCGELTLAAELPQTEVTVVEPSADFANGARRLVEGSPRVTVIESTLEACADRLGSFDMVVVSCLLHEVVDPMALLLAAKGRLSSGGVLHVNVPNARSLHRLLAMAMGLIADPAALSDTQRQMQQRATYDADSLEAVLHEAGLEVSARGSLFVKPFTHAQMQWLVDQGFMTPTMLDGFDRLVDPLPGLGSEIWCNARLRDG
jgi:trans-aconitate methyltransferase